MQEEKLIECLREHLRTAKARDWNVGKMIFCDGILKALNIISDKHYGFSGTNIYFIDDSGNFVYI